MACAPVQGGGALLNPDACEIAEASPPEMPECSADAITPFLGFESDLSWVGGCSDVVFYAIDHERMHAIAVTGPALAEAAAGLGDLSCSYSLPQTALEVTLTTGYYLPHACDQNTTTVTEIDCTWVATAGEVTIDVTPATSTLEARGALTLTDLVFENALGESLSLASLSMEEIYVGWEAR